MDFLGVSLYQRQYGCDLLVEHPMNYKCQPHISFDLARVTCLLNAQNAIRPRLQGIAVRSVISGAEGRPADLTVK